MALIKRSESITNFVLPVKINGYLTNWYYEDEKTLFKAYRQLRGIKNENIKALYPVIY